MFVEKDTSRSAGYYGGQLLIATPQVGDGCFYQSVIYTCVHNEFGAMGIIINQPLPNALRPLIYPHIGLNNHIGLQAQLQLGGPVETEKGFVLHTRDYQTEHTMVTDDGLYVTASSVITPDLSAKHAPEKYILTAGYAGWSAGQLEQEVRNNAWFTVPANDELIFNTSNDEKWISACRSIGVDPFMLSDEAGRA